MLDDDWSRVETANKLYKFVAEAIPILNELGIAWIVENPSNSLMWLTSFFKPIMSDMDKYNCRLINTQMCMHGGQRDKRTALLFSKLLDLSEMELQCDNQHEHLSWGLTKEGVFATAGERNYPVKFCNTIARLAARSLGVVSVDKDKAVTPQSEKVSAGVQPRRGENDIIPEFKDTLVACGEDAVALLKSKEQKKAGLFKGENVKVLDEVSSADSLGSSKKVEVGRYWSKKEFVEESAKLVHPYDRPVRVPQRVAANMHFIASHSPEEVARFRAETLSWYTMRAAQLETEEKSLHAKLHPDVERVVKNKKILLFKEMLKDIRYDDAEVASLLVVGCRVMGTLGKTGIWQGDDTKSAQCPVDSVWANAKAAQASALTPREQDDEELAAAVWKATSEEVSNKLLLGPFSVAQLNSALGPRWVPARRFGIRQGEKVRPIDNFSEHLVNQAFGASEKISMLGVDHVVSWSKAWVLGHRTPGKFQVTDNTGVCWECYRNVGWRHGDGRLVGRVADLANAYKQLPVHPADASVSVIAVQEPKSNKVHLYRALALMFGETGAVYAFLISQALAAVASKLFKLIVVEFFDDFSQLEPLQSQGSALITMEGIPRDIHISFVSLW